MHNVPYGLYLWLSGLLLLIVVVVYVRPWWEARRVRAASDARNTASPPDRNGTGETDTQSDPTP